MNWIAPFKPFIEAQAPMLCQHGFSWIGEDDNQIKFTDGEVLLTFSVERYDDSLSAWVRYLGEAADHEEYRIDMVMRLMDAATTKDFEVKNASDNAKVVARYVTYLIDNKQRLFGPVCTFAKEYEAYEKRRYEELTAQWTRKP